jgi:hypothetical protein
MLDTHSLVFLHHKIFKDTIVRYPFITDARLLFHGTFSEESIQTFIRPAWGFYVTPLYSWAREYYTGLNREFGDDYAGKGYVYALYADVKNTYLCSDKESDIFYARDYDEMENFIARLDKYGFDSIKYRGESESMVLFKDVLIINALTGRPM